MRTGTFGERLALGGLMICAATTAAGKERAGDSGFYVGLDGGIARAPAPAHIQLGNITLESDDIDNSSHTWGAHAGYRFSRYFALELADSDLIRMTGAFRSTSGPVAAQANAKFTTRGPT